MPWFGEIAPEGKSRCLTRDEDGVAHEILGDQVLGNVAVDRTSKFVGHRASVAAEAPIAPSNMSRRLLMGDRCSPERASRRSKPAVSSENLALAQARAMAGRQSSSLVAKLDIHGLRALITLSSYGRIELKHRD